MSQPIITWTDETGTNDVLSLDFGIVDAGDTSQEFTILLWNNKGGETPISDMMDCTITTKDELGGNGTDPSLSAASRELVQNTWIEIHTTRDSTDPEKEFNAIGGFVTKGITAELDSLDGEGNTMINFISGGSNDGDPSTSETAANYAILTFRAVIPSDASSGSINFSTRVSYRYI